MANSPAWYKITDTYNQMYDMEEIGGEGRICKRIYETMINDVDKMNGSTRFVTEEAYKTARAEATNRIEKVAESCKESAVSITVSGTETTYTNDFCRVSYDSNTKSFSEPINSTIFKHRPSFKFLIHYTTPIFALQVKNHIN